MKLDKPLLNALRIERFDRLNSKEKQKLVIRLKKSYSERELEKLTGIPHSTIHDWATGRQNNKGIETHISIDQMIRKLEGYKPKLNEFPKLEKLYKIIENILYPK